MSESDFQTGIINQTRGLRTGEDKENASRNNDENKRNQIK